MFDRKVSWYYFQANEMMLGIWGSGFAGYSGLRFILMSGLFC